MVTYNSVIYFQAGSLSYSNQKTDFFPTDHVNLTYGFLHIFLPGENHHLFPGQTEDFLSFSEA